MRRASSAAIISPVSNISIACFLETLRDRATIGVEQKSPILTPGVANRADDDATAKSQLATSWQPAAVAMPWTWAMTGLGWRTMVCINVEHCLNSDSKKDLPLSLSARRAVISLRSWPDENAGPSAPMTITRTVLSDAAAPNASCMAVINAWLSALRALARLRVRFSTEPLFAARTSGSDVGAFILASAKSCHAFDGL